MATGATEFIDSTTADVFIPEIWSALAIVAREARLVFANLVDRRYEDSLRFGDTIHVPSIGNLTAQTKTKASNSAIVYETVTETNVDITIATWEYSAIAVESIVKVQGNRDLLKAYAGKMGFALDLAVDDVVAGLVDDFGNAVGTLGTPVSYVDWLRARQYLDDSNAPEEDRVMVISPAEESNTMQLDHFINNDYSVLRNGTGGQTGDSSKGFIGRWLGMPIHKSTNVEGSNAAGHDNAMFQKQALCLVMQMKPTSHSMYDIDFFVDKVAMETLYGSREMRDDHGVFVRGA